MEELALVRYDGGEVYPGDVREDNLHNLYWRTREGELIAVPNLHDRHLRNIALMLMGFGYQQFLKPDHIKILWLTALRMEWDTRAERHANEPNPFHWRLSDDGKMVRR
jgi:hypothetical protein